MRRNPVLWFVLLLAGFLTGYILQYARLQRVQQELTASAKQLELCRSGEELSRLRDTATERPENTRKGSLIKLREL
jgi:hypothetical protein